MEGNREQGATVRVKDVMSTDLTTITPDTTLREAANDMLTRGISGLPVLDREGRLVGMLTEADFLVREAHVGRPRRRLLDAFFGSGAEPLELTAQAGQAMTDEVTTVNPEASLTEAARIMMARGVKRLPVIDQAGRLLGIVSRADVLKAFTRDDDDLRVELDELLNRQVAVPDLSKVGVAVEGGVVTLRGQVESRIGARLLVAMVALVDGVVVVQDELEWLVDERLAEESYPGYASEGSDDLQDIGRT